MKSTEIIWEKIHSEREWGKYPNEELVRFIGRNFFKLSTTKRKNIKMLELGIGQGANSWFLIREGFDVYGIDISSSAINKFKIRLENEKLLKQNFETHFKLSDIRKIPFKENKFDVVIDIATTWYVSYSDHKKVFAEVNRILKQEGLFFTWHITKDSWGDDRKNYIDRDTKENVDVGPLSNTGITYFARINDLIELLESSQLKIIEKETLERSYNNMEKFLKYAIITAVKVQEL